MALYRNRDQGQKPPTLSDQELLARYGLVDPGTDAQAFAQMVHDLSAARKAALSCRASYEAGEHVVVIYHITGTDSAGQAIVTASDFARTALANIIRELNKRYARRRLDEQPR